MTEEQLQCEVARWLDSTGLLWTHVANEHRGRGVAGAVAGKRARLKGQKRGVPDVLVFDTPGLAIELKGPRGHTTPEQRTWLAELGKRGWRAAVCRSLDEVIALVLATYPWV